MTIPNPHDALFQMVFSQPEHAAGALQHVLPKEIVDRILWSTLTALPGRFVDKALTSRYTDILFSVMMDGRRVFLYLLFEHQSTDSPLMAFRLLQYETRIWSQFLEMNPSARSLPAIIPVVVHHSEGGWTSATCFEDLLDLDEEMRPLLRPFLPSFRFLLDDVSASRDEDLQARATSGTSSPQWRPRDDSARSVGLLLLPPRPRAGRADREPPRLAGSGGGGPARPERSRCARGDLPLHSAPEQAARAGGRGGAPPLGGR